MLLHQQQQIVTETVSGMNSTPHISNNLCLYPHSSRGECGVGCQPANISSANNVSGWPFAWTLYPRSQAAPSHPDSRLGGRDTGMCSHTASQQEARHARAPSDIVTEQCRLLSSSLLSGFMSYVWNETSGITPPFTLPLLLCRGNLYPLPYYRTCGFCYLVSLFLLRVWATRHRYLLVSVQIPIDTNIYQPA